jgi:predicted transcriptional regulator
MASNAHEGEVTDQNAGKVTTRRTEDTASPASITNSELLTLTRVAPLLGVTRQTVKNYIYKGRLKTYKTPVGIIAFAERTS